MAATSRIPTLSPIAASAGALPVTPRDGDVIEARVAAILPNGQVRLATALGTTDVATTSALEPGATVKLLVQAVGQQFTLALMDAIAGGPSLPGATPADMGSRPASQTQRALLAAIQTALPNQAPPSRLFANLTVAAGPAGGNLPADVRQAAQAVLGHAVRADRPVTADVIRAAMLGSGVFRESRIAAGDSAAGTPAGDLKSALLALRQTLAAMVAASSPTPPPARPAGAATGMQAGLPDGAAAQAAAHPLASPSASPSALPPALPSALAEALARLPAAARQAALPALPTARGPQSPEFAAVLARLGLSSPAEAAPPAPSAGAAVQAMQETEDPPARATSSPVPRIDLPPRAEDPAEASLRPATSRGDAARLLLDQTDATLDRTRIAQYGILHRDDPVFALGHAREAPAAWLFDIPVLPGQGAANAQVRITRDGGHGTDDPAGRRWSVEFALDTIATGPIHAQIRLYGRHVGVTLWAERAETAGSLRDQAAVLHDALGQAELQVEEVSVIAGAPGTPPAERGYFVDTRS